MSDSWQHLESALERARQGLAELDDAERTRHESALDHFAAYVGLLREATLERAPGQGDPQSPATYWLKLEFADGRWTVDHRALPAPPELGDVFAVDDRRWQVRRREFVKPRPAQEPLREMLVCVPA